MFLTFHKRLLISDTEDLNIECGAIPTWYDAHAKKENGVCPIATKEYLHGQHCQNGENQLPNSKPKYLIFLAIYIWQSVNKTLVLFIRCEPQVACHVVGILLKFPSIHYFYFNIVQQLPETIHQHRINNTICDRDWVALSRAVIKFWWVPTNCPHN